MTGDQLTQGWVRLARGAILGGSSLVLATAAHIAAGGSLPGGGLLALTVLALTLVAVSLTARRLRFPVLLTVLAVEQGLLHLLFHAAGTVACATVAMPGHGMDPSTVCGGAEDGTTGWGMLLAHLVAVAATAWLLARGERWLWRATERIHAYATFQPTRLRRRRTAPVTFVVRRVASVVGSSADPRGPPLALS